jgi:hypothetical protein
VAGAEELAGGSRRGSTAQNRSTCPYWHTACRYVASRQIERVGDNAVDIGEQVAFVVSGQFQEFSDASHPEPEHPGLLTAGS